VTFTGAPRAMGLPIGVEPPTMREL
jgi:hypothetical protein